MLAFQRRFILGSHFMSCSGMTVAYGSQLESPSLLGGCCLVLDPTSPPPSGSYAFIIYSIGVYHALIFFPRKVTSSIHRSVIECERDWKPVGASAGRWRASGHLFLKVALVDGSVEAGRVASSREGTKTRQIRRYCKGRPYRQQGSKCSPLSSGATTWRPWSPTWLGKERTAVVTVADVCACVRCAAQRATTELVSWCLLTAVHTRHTQQEPAAAEQQTETECIAATHEKAARRPLHTCCDVDCTTAFKWPIRSSDDGLFVMSRLQMTDEKTDARRATDGCEWVSEEIWAGLNSEVLRTDEARSPWWEASVLIAQPPRPPDGCDLSVNVLAEKRVLAVMYCRCLLTNRRHSVSELPNSDWPSQEALWNKLANRSQHRRLTCTKIMYYIYLKVNIFRLSLAPNDSGLKYTVTRSLIRILPERVKKGSSYMIAAAASQRIMLNEQASDKPVTTYLLQRASQHDNSFWGSGLLALFSQCDSGCVEPSRCFEQQKTRSERIDQQKESLRLRVSSSEVCGWQAGLLD
ncbi:hypothetical protein PR048_006487 [Dryococelus australis]|uniref:Uncharacterized protein n=1 Tax=Dryococelus australis TaxID=614101 RepID=A0ABQ9IC46_9NEOP|nr:hypothetical protein PR048_006487 [Dryococelus australis]